MKTFEMTIFENSMEYSEYLEEIQENFENNIFHDKFLRLLEILFFFIKTTYLKRIVRNKTCKKKYCNRN